MKEKSVLLLGSYGQSNLGDDVLMWNYLELLKQHSFTTIYANANTTELIPEPVKKAYPNLRIIDTYSTSLLAYMRLLKSVDCVVYGGGTLYKELYASTGRGKYSVIIRMMGFNILARFYGTPLYHLNIGIGALRSRMGRWITRCALGAATHTVFRDQKSYDFARNTLRIHTDKITKSTDGLFLNRIWEKSWQDAKLPTLAKKYRRIVGVNVLSDIPDWIDRKQYEQTMRTFVQELLAAGDYVLLVPFQHAFNPHNDKVYMEELFVEELKDKACVLLPETTIDTISSVLRSCDVFVGMRFHSLLLCVVNQVPFVAVAYDTKCWRFVQETNYPHAIELERLDLQALLELYEQTARSTKKTKKQLATIATQLYKEAEETAWKP